MISITCSSTRWLHLIFIICWTWLWLVGRNLLFCWLVLKYIFLLGFLIFNVYFIGNLGGCFILLLAGLRWLRWRDRIFVILVHFRFSGRSLFDYWLWRLWWRQYRLFLNWNLFSCLFLCSSTSIFWWASYYILWPIFIAATPTDRSLLMWCYWLLFFRWIIGFANRLLMTTSTYIWLAASSNLFHSWGHLLLLWSRLLRASWASPILLGGWWCPCMLGWTPLIYFKIWFKLFFSLLQPCSLLLPLLLFFGLLPFNFLQH